MKKIFNIIAAVLLMAGVAAPAFGAVGDSNSLGNIEFKIVGMGVAAEPEYQAVPKGINTLVNTSYASKGYELTEEVLRTPNISSACKGEGTGLSPSFSLVREGGIQAMGRISLKSDT